MRWAGSACLSKKDFESMPSSVNNWMRPVSMNSASAPTPPESSNWHDRPFAIDVDVERVVDGVGYPGAGRAYVDLQCNDAIVLRLEQLDVEEALPHIEGLQDLSACLLDRRADFRKACVAHVAVLVDHLHDALVVAMACGQHHFAVA